VDSSEALGLAEARALPERAPEALTLPEAEMLRETVAVALTLGDALAVTDRVAAVLGLGLARAEAERAADEDAVSSGVDERVGSSCVRVALVLRVDDGEAREERVDVGEGAGVSVATATSGHRRAPGALEIKLAAAVCESPPDLR
jgi:hypothetical protein